MAKKVILPVTNLARPYKHFLEVWEFKEIPEYSPPNHTGEGFYFWASAWKHNRSLVIATSESDADDLPEGKVYVGGFNERWSGTQEDKIERYVYAATVCVKGVAEAIEVLNFKWQLPSKNLAELPEPSFMTNSSQLAANAYN